MMPLIKIRPKQFLITLCGLIGLLPAHATALSFKNFQSKMLSSNVKTVREALKVLPVEYRENFTLMHDSRSLHESSFEFPRVISFGTTAELIVTFNGSPAHRGYGKIETAEFHAPTQRVRLREILFKSTTTNRHGLAANEIDFENRHLIISKPNPMKCMACHAIDPTSKGIQLALSQKPEDRLATYNWESYSRWAGAYGEADDNLSDSESTALERLRRSIGPNNLYAFLKFDKNKTSPYRMSTSDYQLMNRPNLRLTKLLGIRHAQQVANLFYPVATVTDRGRLFDLIFRSTCRSNSYPLFVQLPEQFFAALDVPPTRIVSLSFLKPGTEWDMGQPNFFARGNDGTLPRAILGQIFLKELEKRPDLAPEFSALLATSSETRVLRPSTDRVPPALTSFLTRNLHTYGFEHAQDRFCSILGRLEA